DQLLGAGEVAVAGVAVVARVDDDLAAVDTAPGVDAAGIGLEAVERGAEGVGAELTLDRGDVADLDRGRRHAHVACGVRPARATARRTSGRAARSACGCPACRGRPTGATRAAGRGRVGARG